MREIKFRAWEEETKTMHYDVALDGNVISCRPTRTLLLSRDEYPLMQFTGLKDKNGKDVYEGDIVYHNDSNWEVIYVGESFGATRAAFMLCIRAPATPNTTAAMPENDLEVVGNIHENRELLNN